VIYANEKFIHLFVYLFIYFGFFVQPLTFSFYFIWKLLEDVTKGSSELHGTLDRVWVVPGHVIVSLEGGQKLLTFDCKPASQQQVSDLYLLLIFFLISISLPSLTTRPVLPGGIY
jgi:hypothetical protein